MTTIDWSELTHAYGSAEDIPGLFARLGGSEDDAVWQELWGSLCHQGSVYDASWAAMPTLVDIALERAPGGPIQAVTMAGLITTDPDEDCHKRHASEIGQLLDVARRLRADPTQDAHTFVYLQMAVLAFEGGSVWAEALEGVNSEEYDLECPECEEGLYVAFGSYGVFTSAGDYVTGTGKEENTEGRTELIPAVPDALDGIGARLHGEAVEFGQTEVATALTYVFGKASCPSCEAVFTVSEEIEKQWV
ncbi:hypothetical protein [Streptomyces sp. MBT62]|uniref:hypothetical protein n=1 Tax=Streptomyces sp. MBT62 TaxID=2800410 RepID=UPI001909B269|nr:hypothetical protein [Streptomyces sp. MBT62]MBK3562795.1 hypothetical protein [Streptomyces sp. MBT62]